MKELMVYLKTTETCQLNCEHCFTSGSKGKRVFFNPEKVISFFHRLHKIVPHLENGARLEFHGGEPMLAPLADLNRVYEGCNGLWENTQWGIQSNLVYNLTDEKLIFFDKVTKRQCLGTSWDKNIRFPSEKAEALWESNVRKLVDLGFPVTVMICLTKHTVQLEPVDIIRKMIDLGVSYINFERLTTNGNARDNDLAAGNKVLDAYFVKMYEQTLKHGLHKQIKNMFFDSILNALTKNVHGGERCRDCEQKIFTLNADGTVGGCPNSAVEKPYAQIDWPIMEILYSKGRLKEISCEANRNPLCYSCDVFDICNGDCHQLTWERDVCAAPKSLMRFLKNHGEQQEMNSVLNGYAE